jgi:hypothetical protein
MWKKSLVILIRYLENSKNHVVPLEVMNSKNCLLDEIIYLSSPICKIAKVPHLVSDLDLRNIPTIVSPFIKKDQFSPEGTGFLPSQCYVYQGACVLNSSIYQGHESA